jgi:fatty-acyl-CoA synthase
MSAALSYSSGESEKPLLGDTIGGNFDATVRAFGACDALVDRPTGRRWTYDELAAEVDALALGLLEAGIGRGDRVGIWAPNCAEWTFTQYATAKIGAILVNINPAYRVRELEYVLNQSGTRLLVAAQRFKSSDYAAMIEQARPRCPELADVVLLGTPEWRSLLESGRRLDRAALDRIQLDTDDPINIQYTSGTTGFPKGATLSHHNILNNGYFTGELCGYSEADRICIPVPFYHCFGMVIGNLAATTHGACMVIPAPSFDPVATLEAVQAERCTSLYGVPTMFIAELSLDGFAGYDLSSLRTGVMAGSTCPVEVMKQVMTRMSMPEVGICYGMTETSPVATQTRADDSLDRRVSTVGRVGPHLEVKVIDPATGATVPRGTPGELCTRGYAVMLGYWQQPDKTAEAIDAAHWMHTGDLAVMDDDGYLAITGRIKDMVIRGGENVYPREIEEFLYTHPDILDAQVIGVPDAKYGEELMAWVRLRPGAPGLTAEALRAFCEGQLAHYKIPRYVHIVDEFPMTVTGKVRKVEMRERAIEILGLQLPGVKVLIAGGVGYIGSTIASACSDTGIRPVILDNLVTGRREFAARHEFYEGDIADGALIDRVFAEHPDIFAVIHCAALIVVPESVADPVRYYRANVASSLDFVTHLLRNGCQRLIFSSSAAIYRPGEDLTVDEDSPIDPQSPYARTKAVCEAMLADVAAACPIRVLSLRYFNPIGADPRMRTGLQLPRPTHALGKMIQAHEEGVPFLITGTDYPTRDGSGIRDYIHVWDLAAAHVAALRRLDVLPRPAAVINLGTGTGTTVRELLDAFNRVADRPVRAVEGARRPGDTVGAYTRVDRARRLLGWRPRYDVAEGIRHSLQWAALRDQILSPEAAR